ncbi:MAG: type VI secretion system baseplate subunit TssK [Planctomycetales bacterium]|nr:type VI secretion system baseplate subunit TssK [Planctomycetales bacterium]
MRNPAVNWSEGMFLRPQHFQAAERFRDEVLAENIDFCSPYAYGLQRITISAEALANGSLEFGSLRARWRDGTIICQDETHVERVELGQRLNPKDVGNEPITVYLGLPILQEGQPNVAVGTTGGNQRYVEFRRPADDESTGGNRQEIALRQLNHRILFSHEELAGFDLLPIARLAKSASEDGTYVVDSHYFPPSLATQAWPELSGIIRSIYDTIGSRIQALSEIAHDKKITFSSQSQGDLEKILLIHALNEAYAELGCLAFAGGVHPMVAYTALCRIVGRCAVFSPELTIEQVPKYDHEDLATIFRWALDEIRRLIFSVKEDEYEQRYFVGSGRGMLVQLEPEWFGLEWDWFFGVDPVNIGRDECFQLLKDSIDWKLGSSDKVEEYMTLRKRGIKLRPVPQVPSALPKRGNWVYFQIRREDDAWNHVQATQTMAMRVRSEQIANLDSLEGARRLRLSIDGTAYGLEFAIFAVRNRV